MSQPPHSTSIGDSNVLWQPGQVQEIKGAVATVKMDALDHCQRCLAGEGCGAGVFSKLFAKKGARLDLKLGDAFEVGDRVWVGVSANAVLKASLWLYAWPLALFLISLMVLSRLWGHFGWWGGEGAVLLVSLFFAGWGLKAMGRLRFRALNPIVIPLSCDSVEQSRD